MTPLEQALKLYKAMSIAGTVLVPFWVSLIYVMLFPGEGLLWWLVLLFVNVVSVKVYDWIVFFVSLALVARMNRFAPTIPEIDSPEIEEWTFTITDVPDTVLGRFLDHEFFEWIEVTDNKGVSFKATFFGTADLKEPLTLPPRCVLLPPGLIYQVEPAINIPTKQ